MAITTTTSTQVATQVATPVATRPRIQLAHVDGLRALAALFVLTSHLWAEVWPAEYGRSPSGLLGALTAPLLYAHFAVSVFIVVSGFCLTLPVVRADGALSGGALRFFRRRARRILPPYYCALGLSLALIWLCIGQKTGTHWDVSLPVTPGGVVAHLLLVHDVYAPAQINHALWSIAVEWQIYFLFPLIVLCWRRFGALATTSASVALSGALALAALVVSAKTGANLSGFTPQYIGLFALGGLGATICFDPGAFWANARRAVPWEIVAGGPLALVWALCWLKGFPGPAHLIVFDLLIGCSALGLLVAATRRQEGRLARALAWKPLAGVGVFSYSLYLIHAPLAQVVWQYVAQPMRLGAAGTFAVLLVVGGPLILGAAYLFYRVCERPLHDATRAARRTPATPLASASGAAGAFR